MRVTFWGTRGSIAKAGPTTLRYGGNTSCVEVRTQAGTLLVIDCGTGAHGLGADLLARNGAAPIDGHLLISHTHWDHIQGLPFFAPLFQPESTWHIYGPRGLGGSLIDTLAGQMQYSYFPVSLEQLAANVIYHDLVEGTFEIEDVRITAQYLNHPALTLGYRLDADGATMVYASDHEPHHAELGHGGDLTGNRHDRGHVEFLADADLVIHDAQYVADEYGSKMGWGHSTVEYVVDAACQANAARLALFHHDPSRTDDEIDTIVEDARARAAGTGTEVFAAAEGADIELVGTRPRSTNPAGSAATRQPALEDMGRSVLIAVESPDIATVVREAAQAEGLEISETTDPVEALRIARTEEPAVIVLEDVLDLEGDIRDLRSDYARDVSIVTVSSSNVVAQSDRRSLSDWLLWPFSAVYVRTKLHASLLRQACLWQNAPLPEDEETRVRALQDLGILDTPAEARFDRYTQEASSLLDMPVALVSLIDSDRQWFKSAHGLDLDETPRDLSFCAHAILDNDIFQVPDALDDRRFAHNPAVSDGPRVRFYAGAPLALSDGSTVGTLCVVDYRPRLLTEPQLDELRRLATLVAQELEAPAD
jgi:phosphoribosyl 1,2-cyclic phosphodiesterase/CheY-like chemotaxis protein